MHSLENILQSLGVEPVIVDVGSSGEPQSLFNAISKQTVLVGFEPDDREQSKRFGEKFKRVIFVPKVVIPDDNAEDVEFVLTKSPYCSSLLEPDLKALENFSFSPLFIPERRVKLPATSMNRVVAEKHLSHLDWIKVDAQGADLQIIKGIGRSTFENILAIEVEPGLIDAYKGEDLFPEVHMFMLKAGFWLADLHCQAYPRISAANLDRLKAEFGDTLPNLKASPTAAEARYFRNRQYFELASTPLRSCILGFVFALLTGYSGFAAEILFVMRKRFPAEQRLEMLSQVLRESFENSATTAQQSTTSNSTAPSPDLTQSLKRSIAGQLQKRLPPPAYSLVKSTYRQIHRFF